MHHQGSWAAAKHSACLRPPYPIILWLKNSCGQRGTRTPHPLLKRSPASRETSPGAAVMTAGPRSQPSLQDRWTSDRYLTVVNCREYCGREFWEIPSPPSRSILSCGSWLDWTKWGQGQSLGSGDGLLAASLCLLLPRGVNWGLDSFLGAGHGELGD